MGTGIRLSLARRAVVLIATLLCCSSTDRMAQAADAKEGALIFEDNCISCHTVGEGVRRGPDLHGVLARRDRAWVKKWIADPEGMGENDPIGQKLVAEWKDEERMQQLNLRDAEIEDVIAYIEAESAKPAKAAADKSSGGDGAPQPLAAADFDHAKELYFNRCAGCHGTLRTGATGPKLVPERSKEIGAAGLQVILTKGTPGGMPAFGKEGLLQPDEIKLLSTYLQLPPPEPPQLPLQKIKESWKLLVPPDKRPTSVQTKRDWQDYFGVILRDAGKVAIVDGDAKEVVAVIDTGFAVHILRSSSTGRYFYAVGRDGRISMIDLWPEKPVLVAQVQGCFDARSVDASKAKGFEDKLIIEGCYWPPQYVVMDGQTLEPKGLVDVTTPTYDTNEPLREVRVASIIASHSDPFWLVSLKESGHVAIVDYSKPGFPIVSKIPAERFLHDGGWDHTKRYFMVAANMRNKMVVVDVKDKKLVTKFDTGVKPHPGRGANWEDPKFGWVNGTTHIGEGKFVVYGADPQGKPEHAWKIVREIKLDAPGGLFVKTHPKSKWVWIDSPLSNATDQTRQICAYSKQEGAIDRCWPAAERGRAVHFEYNKDGDEVWVSTWDKEGEIVVYDDETLEEKTRIAGDWLVTPTGKFNVHNTAGDIY